jgi:uncharacterized protein (DUF1697 family)
MPTYIAMLRGVNVGGNMLKMDRLRELWSKLGFKNVRTFIQSGNVIFDSPDPPSKWITMIEKKLAGETRLPIHMVFRTAAELKRVIDANPFLKQPGIDRSKLHITFLGGVVSKEVLKNSGNLTSGPDELRVVGKEAYLHCPQGYGNTKLHNVALEKLLGTKATTRNWNTVNKLYEMASKPASP